MRPTAIEAHGTRTSKHRRRPRNRLLAALSPSNWDLICPDLELVPLRRRQILMDRHMPVQHAYFIEHGVVSLMARTEADGPVGIDLAHGGALIGLPIVLGTMRSLIRAVVEIPGEAYRIEAASLMRGMEASAGVRQLLFGYVHAELTQRSQLVLCGKRHSIEQRLARWLLTAQDELGEDYVRITHAVLSHDLGVRRATITTALAKLEDDGAVRPKWACIEIIDRDRLEKVSCECYRIIETAYRRLMLDVDANSRSEHVSDGDLS